jgi:hypothetical protein
MFVSHRKHAYGPPRAVAEIALLLLFTYTANCEMPERYSQTHFRKPTDILSSVTGHLKFSDQVGQHQYAKFMFTALKGLMYFSVYNSIKLVGIIRSSLIARKYESVGRPLTAHNNILIANENTGHYKGS